MCEFESLGSIVRRLMMDGWAADAGEERSIGRRFAGARNGRPAAKPRMRKGGAVPGGRAPQV